MSFRYEIEDRVKTDNGDTGKVIAKFEYERVLCYVVELDTYKQVKDVYCEDCDWSRFVFAGFVLEKESV